MNGWDKTNALRVACGLAPRVRAVEPPIVVHLRRCTASGRLIRWYAAPSLALVAAAAAGRAGVAAERAPCPEPSPSTLGEP